MKNLELEILKRKKREQNSRRGVFVDLTYIDMAEDLNAGILLSQIIYWNSFDDFGNEKLRVNINGKMFLAKSKKDWYEEIRLSKKQLERSEKILKEKGIVKIEVKKFSGNPTNHYWLDWARFLELEDLILSSEKNSQLDTKTDQNHEKTGSQASVSAECDKRVQTKVQKGSNVCDKRGQTLTETTTKKLEDDEEAFSPIINLFVEANDSISQLQIKILKKLVDKYSIDFVMKAIRVTSDKARNFNMDYIKKVLKSYEKNGYQKIEDIEDAENIENLKKENIEIKRKKNIDKQQATALEKKSKAKNTPLDGDISYAETNEDALTRLAEMGY
jgi:DnaD/phage-associated family protein